MTKKELLENYRNLVIDVNMMEQRLWSHSDNETYF